jgi:hypothetical protein
VRLCTCIVQVEVSALEESITAVEQDIELVNRSGRLGRVLVRPHHML